MRPHNGYNSGIRNDEILPFVTTWVDVQSIMLTAVRQKRTGTYDFTLTMWDSQQKATDGQIF